MYRNYKVVLKKATPTFSNDKSFFLPTRLYKNSSLKSKSSTTIRRFRSELKQAVPCIPIGIIFGRSRAGLPRWHRHVTASRRVPYRFRVREERGPGHVRPRRRPTRDSHLAAGAHGIGIADPACPPPTGRAIEGAQPPSQQPPATARCAVCQRFFFLEGAKGKGDVHSLIFTPYGAHR